MVQFITLLSQVKGHVGRRTSFEIEMNGVQIYSKLKGRGFPDFGEVVRVSKEVSEGKEPTPVTTVQQCSIL